MTDHRTAPDTTWADGPEAVGGAARSRHDAAAALSTPETAAAAPVQLPDDLWLPDDDDAVHWVMAGARQVEPGSSRYLAACGAEITLPPATDSERMRAVLATVAAGRHHRTCARIWRLRWQR